MGGMRVIRLRSNLGKVCTRKDHNYVTLFTGGMVLGLYCYTYAIVIMGNESECGQCDGRDLAPSVGEREERKDEVM